MSFLKNKLNKFIFIYIFFVASIFLARTIIFAASYGGVEHDSGWFLGVAENLAKRGIWASYTNTSILDNKGASPSIHNRFSVQDENGYSYFPAGVTVGAGYIIPEAIFLKIFGYDFWQYRLWPLVSYFFLLIILFYFAWLLGGITSLFIFQIWLWLFPQLTINFSYEALSESIALLFILISFLLFYGYQNSSENKKIKYFFLSGLFASFSFLTKNLFALTIVSFIPFVVMDFWLSRKKIKDWFSRWLLFVLGIFLPILIFESYRFFYLSLNFGRLGYAAINRDILLTFISNGSGINSSDFNFDFFKQKLLIWQSVGLSIPWTSWTIFFISPISIYFSIKKEVKPLIILIYSATIISFLWYLIFCPSGWGRYIWQGLISGMILICSFFSILINSKNMILKLLPVLIIILLFITPYFRQEINAKFILGENEVNLWHNNTLPAGLQGFPSLPIFPLNEQKNLIAFFNKEIKPEDRIYYLSGFLVSEIPPLVDKVFYSLGRYQTNSLKIPDGGNSYLIFGPYQKGNLKLVDNYYYNFYTQKYCEKVVFSSNSYSLCLLKKTI